MLIESHLEGSQLIPVSTEMEIEERIQQDSDPRLVGCFLNGSGKDVPCTVCSYIRFNFMYT